MTGTDILHVAYKGSTGARNDIVGGHVDMMFDEVPSVGTERAGGTGPRARRHRQASARHAAGRADGLGGTVPGYEHTGWFGIMVPAGTPKPIIDKLNAAMRALVARTDVKAIWEKQATETMSMTPEESDGLSARRDREVGEGREGRQHQARVS